jgi:hypothetical protein
MTQLADLVDSPPSIDKVANILADNLCAGLGYNDYKKCKGRL